MTSPFIVMTTVLGLSVPQTQSLARLELSESWLDFGELQVGDSSSETVEIENTGEVSVRIEDVDFGGDDSFQVDGNDCEGVLAPGKSCEIEVQFEPEEAGRFRGDVEIETPIGDLEFQVLGEATTD